MSEIPPPMQINQIVPQPEAKPFMAGLPDFPIPFMLAEACRMMLNFLALDSRLPNAHQNVISQWLLHHNEHLGAYMLATYGQDGAYHANLMAEAMSRQFIQGIANDRDVKEAELFQLLEQQMMGDGDATG